MKQRDQVETELEYNFNETELRKWKCYSFDRLGKIPNIISNALSSLQRNCHFLKNGTTQENTFRGILLM